jgi:hypothetical protein
VTKEVKFPVKIRNELQRVLFLSSTVSSFLPPQQCLVTQQVISRTGMPSGPIGSRQILRPPFWGTTETCRGYVCLPYLSAVSCQAKGLVRRRKSGSKLRKKASAIALENNGRRPHLNRRLGSTLLSGNNLTGSGRSKREQAQYVQSAGVGNTCSSPLLFGCFTSQTRRNCSCPHFGHR